MKREKKNLMLYLVGKGISTFGTSIYAFMISLYILKTYNSTSSFALNMLMGSIPLIVFAPIAGVLCSKHSKKRIAIISDVLNGVLFLALYILKLRGLLTLGMIYFSTFVSVSLMVFLGIAMDSMKPELVDESRLMRINSYGRIIDSMSTILGPVVGGIVFALISVEYFILINGISFLISAVLEGLLNVVITNYNVEQERNVPYKKILRYIIEDDTFRMVLKTAMLLNLFIGMSLQIAVPVLLNKVLEVSSGSYGLIQGSFSIGIIGGALAINRNKCYFEKLKNRELICTYACGVAYIVIAIPVFFTKEIIYVAYYGTILSAFGLFVAIYDVSISFVIQKVKNSEYRSKIMGILIPVIKIFLLIGLLIGGYIIDSVSIYSVLFMSGSLTIIITYLAIEEGNIKRRVVKEKEHI